jgi:hypothetical protein
MQRTRRQCRAAGAEPLGRRGAFAGKLPSGAMPGTAAPADCAAQSAAVVTSRGRPLADSRTYQEGWVNGAGCVEFIQTQCWSSVAVAYHGLARVVTVDGRRRRTDARPSAVHTAKPEQ